MRVGSTKRYSRHDLGRPDRDRLLWNEEMTADCRHAYSPGMYS